jgi:hypothetical protein
MTWNRDSLRFWRNRNGVDAEAKDGPSRAGGSAPLSDADGGYGISSLSSHLGSNS